MIKSTKVKKTKVSKPVASTRKLKKFTNGGGNDIGTLKPKTPLEAAKDLKINQKPIATVQTLEEQKASKQDLMEGLMRPPTKEKETVVTAPKLESKTPVKLPKAKLLPGGFKSEAQRKAYTESLRQKIKSGTPVDQLVKEGYGTKKGLSDLGLGKYSEGLDLKKKGQAKKAEGLVSKSEGLRQKGIGMAVKGKGLRNKAIGKNEDLRPSKSKLTETEKNAVAKYKANPKNQKTLKLDSKELNKKLESVKSGEGNYGNNIVGDLISGPVKAAAAAVGVGAGLYGLYKAGKNLSNVGKAVTKSIATKTVKAGASQLAANTARKVRSLKASKQFADKKALKVFKESSAKKGTLESVIKETPKPNLKNITKRVINREKTIYRHARKGKRNPSIPKFERYAKSKVIKPSNKRFNYNREARKEVAQTELKGVGLKGVLSKAKNSTSKLLEKIKGAKPEQLRKGGKVKLKVTPTKPVKKPIIRRGGKK